MTYLVIGSGSIGKRHHANLTALGKEARLIGWRDLDLTTLDLTGATGLVVATATQVRAELIGRAAEAGVPLYVEKPLAFRTADLQECLRLAAPVAERSVLGLMMRYHPAIRWLSEERPDAYGFHMEIGHDVRQWRPNWRFADSYAALPEGGGVLLDLCHEIDMAACLFPGLSVVSVDCVGHDDFPGVDFATRITVAGQGITGTVAMDYLSPESLRRIAIRGRDEVLDIDLLGPAARRWRGSEAQTKDWTFERNDMFLGLMSDFTALAEGRGPLDNPLLPRLDRVGESARLVTEAWEKRRFHGTLTGGFE